MDNQDAIKYIISKLRTITTAVQIAPFAYGFLYVFALVMYLFASDSVLQILDTLLYVSPVVVAGNLIYSKILKLCKWHKTACILPIIPQFNIIIDEYIHRFTVSYETVHISTIILMTVLLLICAYKVFAK